MQQAATGEPVRLDRPTHSPPAPVRCLALGSLAGRVRRFFGVREMLIVGITLAAQAIAAGAEDPDAYLRYAHPTIREPFADLLNLGVPVELENQRLAALGYVDVTQGPFRADPTGAKDSTQAVQAALVFARDHQMACFFPAGTYLISDTLSCTQQLYKRANGRV
ncbi:MAG: glycosyl hydrolase family 28-related protein, partial [Planctomycetota bacterium]|nr:glycosyl hydrolase family 28-related protein [Planctomycetota bacterium]